MKIRIFLILIIVIQTISGVYAQKKEKNINITGIVTDMNNNPVEGALIFIDSTDTRILTDASGKFRVKTKLPALIISAYSAGHGYCTKEIKNDSPVNLTLGKMAGGIPSYINTSKSYRKGKLSETKKMNTYTDIYQMIRNEVPGVVVSGKSIVVQGPNSFFGSSQPLFVVNGVRVYNIDYLNPVEVKSIKLLKGSSANIYGNEGANGVIVIDLQGTSDKNNLKK